MGTHYNVFFSEGGVGVRESYWGELTYDVSSEKARVGRQREG